MNDPVGHGAEHDSLDQSRAPSPDHHHVGFDRMTVLEQHPGRIAHIFNLDNLDSVKVYVSYH